MQGAIREVFDLRGSCWNLLNSANVTLLRKKEIAQSIDDYKPISVMHRVSKILGKILANRLAPLMDGLVSHCQSAFIEEDQFTTTFNTSKVSSNTSIKQKR
jgi:hypothetical protein